MAGNAVHLMISPPPGARRWRVLRRTTPDFAGHDDAGAVLVHDGADNNLIDLSGLENGLTYHYRAWWHDGVDWHVGGDAQIAPAASWVDWSPDVLGTLRDRIEAGLRVAVQRGSLRHPRGRIPVFKAPPLEDSAPFPVVTLRLLSDSPAEHGIGDDIPGFVVGDESYLGWGSSEGWISRVVVEVVGWTLNPDERLTLRSQLRAVILANQPVFDELGWSLIEFEQRDADDFEQFNAPVYQTIGTFSCLAPAVVVGDEVTPIRDIPVKANSNW